MALLLSLLRPARISFNQPFLLLSLLLLCGAVPALAWRSVLYPQDWTPPAAEVSFETNKLIQDFSHAGYKAGESSIPMVNGPVFNVTNAPFQADPTGAIDSTTAIQNAINAAESAGGGVVYLPAGLFRISLQGANAYVLRMDASGVVLRGAGVGQTRLLNTSTNMRDKIVILVDGPTAAGFFSSGTGTTLLRADVLGPSRVLPVAGTAGLAAGQNVMVRAEASDAWVLEHNEPGWVGYSNALRGVAYFRQVTAVDAVNRTITLDAPTRYYLKTRDAARVIRVGTPLTGSGLEHFSIGNVQREGAGWAEEDYNYSTNASYYVHNSFLIKVQRARDCWIRSVETFLPTGNPATCHLLSNGVLLNECSRVSVVDCHFQRPQFGGGGGNGYMYRLQHANNCLLERCRSTYSRHGMVLSHMGSSGNVFHNCVDTDTGHQTGITGSGSTSGRNCDHHMHFSHSNLIDASTGDNSAWEARYRPYGSVPYHDVTSAHGVYWNMLGTGSGSATIVSTEQSRYGYAIGTRGTRTTVSLPTYGGTKCNPPDHVEGAGQGDTLEPSSLYEDQLARRLGLVEVSVPEIFSVPFPSNTVVPRISVTVGRQPAAEGAVSAAWDVLSTNGSVVFSASNSLMPQVTFAWRGAHTLRVVVSSGALSSTAKVEVVLAPPATSGRQVVEPSADAFVRDGAYSADNYGDATYLAFKKSTAGYNRRAFLRFSLAGAPAFRQATLSLRSQAPPTPANAPTLELRAAGMAWSEHTVTWTNQPAMDQVLHTYAMSTNGADDLDVTIESQAAWALAGELALAIVVASQPGTEMFSYQSREDVGGLRPQLALTTAGFPPFAEWITNYASIPAGQRGPEQDPDGDGLVSGLEQVLARNPVVPEADSPVRPLRANGVTQFVFRHARLLPVTVSYYFEMSERLAGPWRLAQEVAYTLSDADPDRIEVLAEIPDGFASAERYYRLVWTGL